MNFTEQQLAECFRKGDRAAFEELVSRWNQNVTNLAYRMTGNQEDARDMAQQCFLRAFQARDQFEGGSSLGTWLYRITINLCRDRLRSQQSRRRQIERLATRRPRPGHRPPPPPELESEQGEVSTQVAHAVTTLTDDQREVVILRHYHDLSCREIAEILQTPYTTVRSRLVQGLNELRLKLRDLNPCVCS